MSRVHCRCRACGARQAKPKAPEEYVTAPVCRRCKAKWYRPRTAGKNVVCSLVPALRVDTWANARSWRKHTCYCDGYHYPHRQGSRWCYENPCYGHTIDELGTERSPFYLHDEEDEHEHDSEPYSPDRCGGGHPPVPDAGCHHHEGGDRATEPGPEYSPAGRRAGHELQQPVTQIAGAGGLDDRRRGGVPPAVRRGPDGRAVAMSELAEKLKAMGWTQVVVFKDRGVFPQDTYFVQFQLQQRDGFSWSSVGRPMAQHWRAELRRQASGKWHLLLREDGDVPGRGAELLDTFDDPISATMALKVEGNGSIARGVQAWRTDTFGWLPGELKEDKP